MCGTILLDIRLLVCHNSPVGNYGIKSDHRKGVRQPARDGKVQKAMRPPPATAGHGNQGRYAALCWWPHPVGRCRIRT